MKENCAMGGGKDKGEWNRDKRNREEAMSRGEAVGGRAGRG